MPSYYIEYINILHSIYNIDNEKGLDLVDLEARQRPEGTVHGQGEQGWESYCLYLSFVGKEKVIVKSFVQFSESWNCVVLQIYQSTYIWLISTIHVDFSLVQS